LDELVKDSILCKPNWLSCVTLTGGPTEEAAQILDLSVSTVKDDRAFSRGLASSSPRRQIALNFHLSLFRGNLVSLIGGDIIFETAANQ